MLSQVSCSQLHFPSIFLLLKLKLLCFFFLCAYVIAEFLWRYHLHQKTNCFPPQIALLFTSKDFEGVTYGQQSPGINVYPAKPLCRGQWHGGMRLRCSNGVVEAQYGVTGFPIMLLPRQPSPSPMNGLLTSTPWSQGTGNLCIGHLYFLLRRRKYFWSPMSRPPGHWQCFSAH
jgi:hypothetical protein